MPRTGMEPLPEHRGLQEAAARTCRNCEAQVADNYCPRCGQSVHDHAKSVVHWLEEALEAFLHFDSRLARTVKGLVVAPGRMTADYNDGKRAGYVPPVRLYVFVSVMFFVTLAFTHVGLVAIAWRSAEAMHVDPTELAEAKATVTRDLSRAFGRSGSETPEEGASGVERARDEGSATGALDAIPDFRFFVDLDRWKENDSRAAAAMVKAVEESHAPSWAVRMVRGLVSGSEHPEDLSHLFSGNLSKLILVMMPVFALMMTALYWRQRRYFVEHLTFSIHFHSFMFIVLTIVVLGQKLVGTPLTGHPGVAGALALGFGVYLFFSMKRVYRQGWIKTPLKFVLVSASYFVLFAISFVALLMWTLPSMIRS